jgi:TP901 family phage tail tape measure protein
MAAMGGGLSLGTLWVNIAADTAEAISSIKAFGDVVGAEIDKQKQKWDSLKTVGESLTTLGASLTAGLTLPIAGIAAAATKAAGDFESSMNKITAVGGQTGAELDALRAQAMKLGADTKYSAQEAADGMGNLAAAGFNTMKIMSAMPGVLDLAAAGELSVARAAEVTTDTLAQFGLGADQAGRIANVMAAGAAASSISVEQMAQAMKYAGTVAKSAGMSLEQTATATALLGNAGIKSEQAGTALRGMLGSLIAPGKHAAETLDALGVKTTDAAGKMLPLENIFTQLRDKGASTADMFQIFGREGATAAEALKSSVGPAWAAMTKEIENSEGAAKRMADILNSGLAGGFEQLKGSVDTALISLGNVLLPILTNLVEVATKFVNDFILPAIKWFGELPQPVQNAALAFAAVAAAIGPIILGIGAMITLFTTLGPALGAMAGGLGLTTAGMFGLAAAIAVAIAALVALGTWIYQNWDQITVSFLTQAIKMEKAIASFYQAVGLGGTQVFKQVQQNIAGWSKDIETATKRIADNAAAAKKMKDEQAKLAVAIKKSKDEGANAAAAIANLTNAHTAGAKAAKAHAAETVTLAKATKDFIPPGTAFGDVLEATHKKVVPAGEALYQWSVQAGKMQQKALDAQMPVAALGNYVKATFTPTMKDAAAALDIVGASTAAVKTPAVELEQAIKALGLTSAEKYSQVSADAAAAYKVVVSSDQASKWEKDSAFIKLLEAEEAAMRANGIAIPEYHAQMLADLKAKTEDPAKGLPATKGLFDNFGKEVSTAITNFAQDISKSLWEGNTSWGEKGKQLLSSLGQAVTTAFIEPATKAIADFITGAIKDLLGGKGLGGVFDSLKDIGKAATDIFQKGGDVAGAAPGVPAAGGGAGGAGGAGSAVSAGLTGWIGAIGSAVTAISSVISNFQQAKMETTLNAIEESTRRTLLYVGDRGDGGILGQAFRIASALEFGPLVVVMEDFRNKFFDWTGVINPMVETIRNTLWDVAGYSQHVSELLDVYLAASDARGLREESLLAKMMATVERIAVTSERALTMNLNGTDPSLVAGRVAQQLRLQGGVA